MLSPSTLNRVSASYRKGYYDGYQNKPNQYQSNPQLMKPFGKFDYQEGYKAGANDKKWAICQ